MIHKDIKIQQFINYAEKLNLKVKIHPSDSSFLIIENCTELQGREFCKTFKASGSSCGRNGENYKIGNFEKYK